MTSGAAAFRGMTYALDPQLAEAMAPLLAALAEAPAPAAGDWRTRRAGVEELMRGLTAGRPRPDVPVTPYEASAEDGTAIALSWYAPPEPSGSAALYIHGGGMILGSVELYDVAIATYVAGSGVPILAVDYRLAPEHPHPTPVEDCLTALRWLTDRAPELGVDPDRIAVMGDSAGGGLAAGVALLARDRGGPAIARQILIYPMLDDRTLVPDPTLIPFATWTYDDNITGWQSLLGDQAGSDTTSPYAAPARATDLTHLPPAYIEVGELDIFRDEDITYAQRLAATGTSVELHVHPGGIHAYDLFAPTSDLTTRATTDRLRALRQI
jgi:acetyl esterase/lipase